jgi:hypothetical protein
VLVLGSLASQPNQEARYLHPLLPLVAAIVALAVTAPRVRAVVAAATAVLAAEYVGVTLQSFGIAQASALVSYRIAEPVREPGFAAALDDIVRRTCTEKAAWKINMVGGEYPWLNANTLEMLAFSRYAESGRRCYYTSLGYAESDPADAWARVQEFKPPYYVSVEYGNARNELPQTYAPAAARADAFNRVNRVIFERVSRSRRFEVVPGSRRDGVVVFRRIDRD